MIKQRSNGQEESIVRVVPLDSIDSFAEGWRSGREFERGQAGCVTFLLGIILGACGGLVVGLLLFS